MKKPIPHLEVLGEMNTPLRMEHLRNSLVKQSTQPTGTGGDAVDEVFHHVRHERRRVIGILHSGQRKLVLAIAELCAPEWNQRVLDV
jgi:hypothetical protein